MGRQRLLHELGPRLRERRPRRRPPHRRHQQLLRRAVRLHRAGHLLLSRGHPGLGRHRLQLPHRQVRHRLRRTLRLCGRARRQDERRGARPWRQHRHHGPVHDGRLQQRQPLGRPAELGGQDGRMVPQARRHHGRQRLGGPERVDHRALPGRLHHLDASHPGAPRCRLHLLPRKRRLLQARHHPHHRPAADQRLRRLESGVWRLVLPELRRRQGHRVGDRLGALVLPGRLQGRSHGDRLAPRWHQLVLPRWLQGRCHGDRLGQ